MPVALLIFADAFAVARCFGQECKILAEDRLFWHISSPTEKSFVFLNIRIV